MTQPLDFSSPQHEAMALIRMLRSVPLNMTRGRSEGIAELLERLIILTNDAREFDGFVYCKAQVPAIGARILARTSRSERTVQRWTNDAKSLGLLEVEYRSQQYGGHNWNVYSINMRALRTLLDSGRHGATRGDTMSGLGGDTMSGLTHRRNHIEETNNKQATAVVVVSLEEVGIVDPEKTYSLARSVLQLTDEQILERIAHWRSLPTDHPHRHSGPGVLHRWLTRPRSWHSPTTEQPKLQLRKLRDCTQENRRAELIRYGKLKGWTHQQLQTAVMRLEDECLRPEEISCQPQPESREANQLTLVRTQKPLNRKF